MSFEEIDTGSIPAAVVDADRLERNLARWQEHCDRHGLANRPHVKTHRCAEIAQRQLALGAVGVTCQKLSEAEAMADAGCTDILVPYNIVGAAKLERLRGLLDGSPSPSRSTTRRFCLVSRRRPPARESLGILVDCDTGLGRTGVQSPEAAVDLAVAVAGHDGLRFEGFLTYPAPANAEPFLAAAVDGGATAGSTSRSSPREGRPRCGRATRCARRLRSTEWARTSSTTATVAAGAATLDDVALTVHATVVSRPTPDARDPRLRLEGAHVGPWTRRRVRPRARGTGLTGREAQRGARVRGALLQETISRSVNTCASSRTTPASS